MKCFKEPLLICALCFFLTSPLKAEEKRFVEIPGPTGNTEIFDLASVQMIAPGRFTIQSVSLDDVDVMKLKLAVLRAQDHLCKVAEAGRYKAPQEVFTLGAPDLPVSDFEVKNESGTKFVQWSFPYKRLAGGGSQQDVSFLRCGGASDYLDAMRSITNGIRTKYLYDCKRGLAGSFLPGDVNDPTNAMTVFVKEGTYAAIFYETVCLAVTKQDPYMPK